MTTPQTDTHVREQTRRDEQAHKYAPARDLEGFGDGGWSLTSIAHLADLGE